MIDWRMVGRIATLIGAGVAVAILGFILIAGAAMWGLAFFMD